MFRVSKDSPVYYLGGLVERKTIVGRVSGIGWESLRRMNH